MKHSEFKMGCCFTTALGELRWLCTDIGTRVVVAVPLSHDIMGPVAGQITRLTYEDDPSWYEGPPYALAETVFDEYDQEGCILCGT